MSARTIRDIASVGYRRTAALVGAVTGRTASLLANRRGQVLILMYHRVLPDEADVSGLEPGMFVRASTFERQVAWIKERWPVRTLGRAIAEPPAEEAPAVCVITFDDGWRDNLTVAWPILKRHDVPATIFVVSDWIAAGRNEHGDFVRPDELGLLSRAGIEIGAHTASHPRLDRVDEREAEAEMRGAKEAVERWTDGPCRVFAYPYGAHDETTAALARRIFSGAVRVGGGWWSPGTDPARLPRIGIHQDMSSTRSLFESRIAGEGR